MELEIISYSDLFDRKQTFVTRKIEQALFLTGIIGVRGVPDFENKCRTFIHAARKFSSLDNAIKQRYAPNRDAGDTEGYELGAEWFKNKNGEWQIDDKKASFYSFVPDHPRNKWPQEMDLKTPYLELGELIFSVGKSLMNKIGLNELVGLQIDKLVGYGRMLHYHKENDETIENPNWCGAHLDHGVFTGLIPAYYFQNDIEVPEPEEAGLYIVPSHADHFEKINASDKSVLFFQVGEFSQLIMNDKIKATRHKVQKAKGNIERYTFALFYSAADDMVIHSNSILTKDERYQSNQSIDGKISYKDWEKASYERYRAR